MINIENQKLYQHLELDNDGCYYHFMNRDVQPYRNENKELTALFKDFETRCEQHLYIKGNRLFFTINGVKYYEILTHSTWEWNNIGKLIKQMNSIAVDIFYFGGELD